MGVSKKDFDELVDTVEKIREAIHLNRKEYRTRLKRLECKHNFTTIEPTNHGFFKEVCNNCKLTLARLTYTEYLEREVKRQAKSLKQDKAELKKRKEREAKILKGGV